MKIKRIPIALTIAGSDSGGGAGIQADLKTFFTLGVHGTSVITCITAQNPSAVLGIQEINPSMVQKQLEAVFNGLQPAAAKTGMLYSKAIIGVVGKFLERKNFTNLIIDPVMISSSGATLLQSDTLNALIEELFPLGKLITPNLDEASVLLEQKIETVDDLRNAARDLNRRFKCAVLLKGGHLNNLDEAIDIYQDGKNELLLKATRIKNARTHGTGCTFSAAITSYLAKGLDVQSAVIAAKKYITQVIARSVKINEYTALGWS